MSSKIYFSNKSGKSLLWYLINASIRLAYLIAPSITKKQLRRLLLKPQNRKAPAIPSNIEKQTYKTEYGELAVFETGDKDKPIILFTHGWSGASSQFYELMQSTADDGFHCIAFDHYAHHMSGGKECNFPLFVIGLREIIDKLELHNKLHCVISHSMGVAGTVNVFAGKATPHFFIAPFFDFWHELSTRITGAGIPTFLFKKIIDDIEKDYQITIKNLEPDLHLPTIDAPITIVHDPEDKFALYKFSQHYAEQFAHIKLHTIEAMGHMRIIKAPQTQTMLKDFLTTLQ